MPAIASLVIPAHNEEQVIAGLLAGLDRDARPDEFEIVVVCNGCTDKTAEVAARFSPAVNVIEIAEPSKQAAIKQGDLVARTFPRLYVDADVEIGASDVRQLVVALSSPGVLATAPARLIPKRGVGWLVRSYYQVWEELPQVRAGLFGRGVIALSAAGFARIAALPPAMSDDLAISEAFAPTERMIVEGAKVVIRPPRTVRDLVRRRIRVQTGNAQFDQTTGRQGESKTSLRTLGEVARRKPKLAGKAMVFLSVAVIARVGARRRVRSGDFTTWLRDESSRQSSS